MAIKPFMPPPRRRAPSPAADHPTATVHVLRPPAPKAQDRDMSPADRARLDAAGVRIEVVSGVEYLARVQDGGRLWMVTTRGRSVDELLGAVEDLEHAHESGVRRGRELGRADVRAEIQVALGLVTPSGRTAE
jgi:hypothetical protein